MPRRKQTSDNENVSSPPLMTEEARENVCITLAMNLAEKQLRDGTASPSVITHYLKMGSPKTRLEIEQMREDIKLTRAKTTAVTEAKELTDIYKEAMKAFGIYSGKSNPEEEEMYD